MFEFLSKAIPSLSKAKCRFRVLIIEDGEFLHRTTGWRRNSKDASEDVKRLLKRLSRKYGHSTLMIRMETKPERILGVDCEWKRP